MISCYAIINSSTNVVENVVMANNSSDISTSSGQSVVLGNRFVKKGMIYDPGTGTFPAVGDKEDKRVLRDEIQKLEEEHQTEMDNHPSMSDDERETHTTYLSQLGDIAAKPTYAEMKTAWDAKPNAPTFTAEPVEIDESAFRSELTLTEKVLWDNPTTGTSAQQAIINTMKTDFPFIGSAIQEYLNSLETNEVIGTGRADAIYTSLTA
jgi:hypothetical protein